MSEKRHESFINSMCLVELSDIDDAKVTDGIIKKRFLKFLFIYYFLNHNFFLLICYLEKD